MNLKKAILFCLILISFGVVACGTEKTEEPILYIGGIPDQNTAVLVRRFDEIANYLSKTMDISVEYKPSLDYSAVVTGFRNGDIHLAWFGGLTGIQARGSVPGSLALAQRPQDENFHSVFIVGNHVDANSLTDLKDLSFTFGSESSTSGHLMPRFFLIEAGVDPKEHFRFPPGFSGSHDRTWKLVEVGAFQSGALNLSVWNKAVTNGDVDQTKVRVLETTPAYYDYNWSARGDLDDKFGNGFILRLQKALLDLHDESQYKDILDAFQTEKFISTENGNYSKIEQIAKELGLLE